VQSRGLLPRRYHGFGFRDFLSWKLVEMVAKKIASAVVDVLILVELLIALPRATVFCWVLFSKPWRSFSLIRSSEEQ
jgi:hypothetical protein